jgi:hypothetical protein
MKNKMEDIRNHLIAAMEGLADPDNPLDIERARAISEIGQVLINSAKVEVEYIKVAGGHGTGFLVEREPQPTPPRLISRGQS